MERRSDRRRSSRRAQEAPASLLGGGYTVNGTILQRLIVSVTRAEPNADLSGYSVTIFRLLDDADVPSPDHLGATVTAWAICKPSS